MDRLKITRKILMEATRSQLINKSKKGDSYARSNQYRGKNRWERRKYSKIATQVKDFNSIDLNALFKGDMLEFTIPVQGETNNYQVVILFEKVLEEIREQVKRNNNKLEYKCILRALLRVFNSDSVYVSCSCPDFKYSFQYWSTRNQYNSGTPQASNGKGIRNPNDTKGAACKHINLCLANLNWMMKIASVINNYIWYCKDNMENNYAQYIFPVVYGMPYDKAVQLTLDNFDDKGNLISDPDLATDIATINLANALGKRRTQFKKAPEQSVNPRYVPPKKEKPISNKLGLNLDNEKEANESLLEKIVKLDNGQWQVQSEKGRNLGTYNSKEEAEKRLKQVEYFKHKTDESLDVVAYRGTGKSAGGSLYGIGKYYASSKEDASMYGDVSEHNIHLGNPLTIPGEDTLDAYVVNNFKNEVEKRVPDYFKEFHPIEALPKGISTEIVKELGYDGVIAKFKNGSQYYVVFNNNINEGLDIDDIPQILYHATFKPYLEEIKKVGKLAINPPHDNYHFDNDRCIYLAGNKYVAESFAENSDYVPEEYRNQIVILKVETKNLDLDYLEYDPNITVYSTDKTDKCFAYYKDIPYNYLTIVDINESLDEYYKTNKFEPYTAGYILENGELIILNEYHGEEPEFRDKGYPEFSNTHFEEDTCVRIYDEPTEAQYKRLEEIIDYYLDNEQYCKVEINKDFYKVYSLVEGACQDPYWKEEIGNWTGYKLVNIIKNYFNNEDCVTVLNNNIKESLQPVLKDKGFKFNDNPVKGASYLMSDGTFLGMEENKDIIGNINGKTTHPDLDFWLVDNELVPLEGDANRTLIKSDNAIRLNDGTNFVDEAATISLPSNPLSSAQIRQLKNWLVDTIYLIGVKRIDVGEEATDSFQSFDIDLDVEDNIDEIMNFIQNKFK